MSTYDKLITDVRLVRPDEDVRPADIAVNDGRFARIADHIDPSAAAEVIDGGGRLMFPGVVDVHQHWGIYNDLGEDADSESRAAAQGGVTTGITYMRTGQYYLNRAGAYAEFYPEVLDRTRGRAWIDYGFHLAPMTKQHIGEIGDLIADHGVPSFKIFMFYGSHGLHGSSADQSSFLMIPPNERYDYAHFEFVMRGIEKARQDPRFADIADAISLSLHCETAEIMRAYTEIVQQEGTLTGLAAYSASRPPHSEGLAVTIASYLAHETGLANINLLHLSSAKAMEAAMLMAKTFPHIDFRREVTIGHLVSDIETAAGIGGKVNPPIRDRSDVEALWEHLLAGHVSWVTSDHACCKQEQKFGSDQEDIFAAKSGFGGSEYVLTGLVTEGRRRGLPFGEIAALTSRNPARRFGLRNKGAIEPGFDADFALVDDARPSVIHAADSLSTQEYTPFEGLQLTAAVTDTFLRGSAVLRDGKIVGRPRGTYLSRPTPRP